MPKLVIDLDDTIAYGQDGQDFETSKPNMEVVKKVNMLHDELGFEVVIHTSRGMVSCCGDMNMILDKYYSKVKQWLDANNVHYDDILFMKPLADLYVDDKAMGVNEFVDSDIRFLGGGGSGSDVVRIGRYVKKKFKDFSERVAYQEWCKSNRKLKVFSMPEDISYSYDSVMIEYVDGTQLCFIDVEEAKRLVLSLVGTCLFERKFDKGFEFDVSKQVDVLMKNKNQGGGSEFDSMIDSIASAIRAESEVLSLGHNSFCHGDLITSNVICDGYRMKVIDQRYIKGSSSYLLDLAKLKMSLMGYERLFFNGTDLSSLVKHLDNVTSTMGVKRYVDLFTLMYIARLYRYKDNDGKKKVVKWAKEACDALQVGWH